MGIIFHYDICSLFILASIFTALVVRRNIKGRTNMFFAAMVLSLFVSSLMDAIIIHLCSIHDRQYPVYILYIVDFVYFVFRNIAPVLYLGYLTSVFGIWYKVKTNKYFNLMYYIPYILNIVILVLNFYFKNVFYFDENYVFHKGPLAYVMFVTGFLYVAAYLYTLIRYRNMLPKSKFWVMFAFIPANALPAFLTMIHININVDVIVTALFYVVVSVTIQKPEEDYDFITGTKSYNAFLIEMNKAQKVSNPLVVVIFKFTNHRSIRDGIGFEKYSKVLRVIASNIEKANKFAKSRAEVYYLDNGIFAIVAANSRKENMKNVASMIKGFSDETISFNQLVIKLEYQICSINFPEDIATVDSLTSFINDINNKLPKSDDVTYLTAMAATKEFKMRNEMDHIINRGIINRNFLMYYQPIYSIKDDQFLSAEALIRLIDEEYGFVSPGLFIPVSERSGSIHQIGDYVFDAVCTFMATDEYKALGMHSMEINLSAAQCIEYDLVDKFKRVTREKKIKPSSINLEITETAVDYDPTITDINISKLRDLGFMFSLDDYGTGYSNIKRVVSLPLDIVKLDKSLVDEMDDPMMWTVITNTVSMIKKMGKLILVEGVETAEAVKKFTDLGCDYIQGFYFSKPLPEKEFIQFVSSYNSEHGKKED